MPKQIFRYSFAEAMHLRYEIVVDGSVKVATPMGEMNNPVNITMQISQTVVNCNENEAMIKVCIDQVKSDKNIPAESLPKTGVESFMRMDTLGNVRWVDGQAAWQGAEHSMMRFPDQALQPGDTWVQAVEDATGSATAFHTRYRFKGLDKKRDNLAVFTTELFSAHPDDSSAKVIGSGTFTFDLADNWISGCSNHICYDFRMPVPDNPAMSFVTTTTLDIDMERL